MERDTERAESLLRRSSEQGNKYAAYTLGKAYLDGDVLAQSIDEAVRLLNLSASKWLCSGTVYPRQAVIQRRGRAEGYKESC